ncbi:hypothetical protein [Sphingobacterium paludis]|nr:hypothetical protein [Sphingobacterium paludis]
MTKDIFDWKASLRYNRPAWPQYFVDKTYVDFMRVKYNFREMPLIVFTDEHGRLLRRVEGFHDENMDDYAAYIDAVLR